MANRRNASADKFIRRGLAVLQSKSPTMLRRDAAKYVKPLIEELFLKSMHRRIRRYEKPGRPSSTTLIPDEIISRVAEMVIANHEERRKEKERQGRGEFTSYVAHGFFKDKAEEFCGDRALFSLLRRRVYACPLYVKWKKETERRK